MMPRSAVVLVLVLVLGSLALAPPARAEPMAPPIDSLSAAECRTQTARSPVQIAGNRVASDLRGTEPTLSIALNETLCLRIERAGTRVTGLQLVPSAKQADDLLRVRLTFDGRQTMLALGSGPDPLHYRVGHAVRGRLELVPLTDGTTWGDRTALHVWPGRIDELVLFGLHIRANPAPPRVIERQEPGAWISFWLNVGLYFNQLDDLNDELEEHGYTHVASLQPLGGFGFDVVVSRLHFSLVFAGLGERGFERVEDGAEFGLGQVIVGLEAGYVIWRIDRFELYGGLGINAGDVHFDLDPESPAILPEQFGEQNVRETIRRNLYGLHVQLGADFRVPFARGAGVLFSLRGGYRQQLGQESFVHEDSALPALRGGPSLDTSGPFVGFLVGIYAGF